MSIELRLPELAESVTSAKLAVWLKQEGEAVTAGEPVAEVETEKTSVELEAPASGVLRKIVVPAGTDDLEAGTLLAVVDDGPAASGHSIAVDPPSTEVGDPVAELTAALDAPGGGAATERRATVPAPPGNLGVLATPLARRMAMAAGVDLLRMVGTGRDGRISKTDMERVLRERRAGELPVVTSSEESRPLGAAFEERPLSAMRRVAAARLVEAQQTIPHFYLRADFGADALLALRARVNVEHLDTPVTLTDLIVRATALALRRVPLANSTWADGAVRVYEAADIAVAVNTTRGLITPVVRGADRKDLATIARELRWLTGRAREGTLTPREYTGGTFTVSNLGMYGVQSLYAIVNPPQSCILGVGAAERRPIVRDGELAVGTVITCTLSADHRAIDGATGAELLATLRELIEHPAPLMP